MPIQPLSLTIGAFSGDSQSQNPWSLSNIYSPSGSINLYINKLGQIKVIDGFSKQNATAFTTDTGATAAMIRGLYQYRKIAAGVTTRQVLFVLDDQVNEWELHYTTDLGVTQTFITGGDFGAASINTIPDFATFGDQLFVTNGVIVPQMWDGTTLIAAGATQLAAPTLTATGTGLLSGSFKARIVPILANQQRKPGSVSSAAIQFQNGQLKIDWTADADGTVKGYEIYRTTGSGMDFYLDAYVDGRLTITYTTNLADFTLLTHVALQLVASFGDPPPTGAYFCVAHKGRMWWLSTDAFPRRFWWSDPGDPDSVYQDRSYSECTDAKTLGDKIVGGTGEFNGAIVIWLQNSIWTVSGTGQIINNVIDWRKRRSDATTGTVHRRATVRVPNGSVFIDANGDKQTVTSTVLAFLSPLKDIRLFDGNTDQIISFAKKDTLDRLNLASAQKSYAYVDEVHGMVVWVFPADSSTEPNLSVAWNYWYGTWHEWTGTSFGHVLSGAESSSVQNVVLAGQALPATGGFLYKLWTGADQAGASIVATLMTKGIYPPVTQSAGISGPPDMSHEKRLEKMVLLFDKDASPTSITVGLLPPDAADGDTPTVSRTVSGSTRVSVPARQTAAGTNPGKFFFGYGWRLKLTSTGTTGPWVLQAVEHLYLPLSGQTR